MAREAAMSRRHFEFIGNVINALDLHQSLTTQAEMRLRIAREFARALEGVNPSFQREFFINYATRRDTAPRKLTKRGAAPA